MQEKYGGGIDAGRPGLLETVAHGSTDTSKVVGRTVEEIELPDGAMIAAMVRGDNVIMAHHDEVIENDDHVILFLTKTDEKNIRAVEKLFQPAATMI